MEATKVNAPVLLLLILSDRRESFILRQTHFSVSSDNAVALKYYIEFRSNAVWRFQEVNSCLKVAK
jgi:hypothetical protein